MPIGTLKNLCYGLALPLLGQACEWKAKTPVGRALHRRRTVGACVQRFEKGKLTHCEAVGFATLESEKRAVEPDTLFRTASIAKMAVALLVFRLQTLGKLHVQQDISDFAGSSVRNPHCPDAPITLGMLLSHTSTLVDSPAYFRSYQEPAALSRLLNDPAAWLPAVPGISFRYSNLGAGLVACLLEKQFGESLEALMQTYLLEPLHIRATFDLSALPEGVVADSYRVLPKGRAFDAESRRKTSVSLEKPDPQHHYLAAAGGLFISAPDLARLTLVAWNGRDGFLDAQSLRQMQRPIAGWPEKQVPMRHGMGLLRIDDARLSKRPLWGHQGFAYGAVNSVFFDEEGNGFAQLNSGASEQRIGHLALVNRDLIRLWMKE